MKYVVTSAEMKACDYGTTGQTGDVYKRQEWNDPSERIFLIQQEGP